MAKMELAMVGASPLAELIRELARAPGTKFGASPNSHISSPGTVNRGIERAWSR